MDPVRASEIDATEQALRTTLENMAAMAAGEGVPVDMLVRAWRLADRLAIAVDPDAAADNGDDAESDRELDAAKREAANLAARLVRLERRLLETVHH